MDLLWMPWASVRESDWVVLTRIVPVSLADHMSGGGYPRGTRGVVIHRAGSRCQVELDCGLGTTRVTVAASRLRVVRRRGGAVAFRRAAHRRQAVRAGLVLAFIAPYVLFSFEYVWTHRTLSGLAAALAVATVDAGLEMLAVLLAHPKQAAIYLRVTSLLARLAFGRRGR